jgi:hypothetical protein
MKLPAAGKWKFQIPLADLVYNDELSLELWKEIYALLLGFCKHG